MKLLFLSGLLPKEEGEGIETTSYALAEMVLAWQRLGHKIITIRPYWIPAEGIALKNSKFSYMELDINVVPVLRVPVIFKYSSGSILRFIQKQGFDPDVIIGHMSHCIRIGQNLSRSLNKPFLAGIHAGDIKLMETDPSFLLPQLESAAGIWARSLVIKKKLLQIDSLSNKNLGDCFSGIDKSILTNGSETMSKWEPENLDEIRFISAGNLIGLKNFEEVILGLSKIEGQKWRYDIYGDGPKKEALLRQISSLGLSEKVFLKGFQPNEQVLQAMEESHFHVMPSVGETFGLSYLEAAAKACINIGLENSGMDGIFRDSINSLMLKANIEDDLSTRLNSFFKTDPSSLKPIALSSLNKVPEFESSLLAQDQISFVSKIVANWNSH